MTDHSRRSAREAWAERIERFESAGQTVAEFCSDEGVSPAGPTRTLGKMRGNGLTCAVA